MTTLNEQKVTALARVLGEGLRDEAKLDMSWLVVQALADLEAVHIRALARFAEYPTDAEVEAQYQHDSQTEVFRLQQERRDYWNSLPAPVISTLVRHGLVGQMAGFGGPMGGGSVTDFGRDVLRYLEQVRSEADDIAAPPA
jgi:hypothetical protein